ncbi:MAG: hypothetical protein UX26_C0011G0025 [Parcubacteria group bacterium GW2011_GWC1_45_9]|nr:MAG: hypothetical protein UW85_C0003G0031 [Parcubacteria group bacterium GW2011_GWA1_Parcubacteria_45_10]KKU16970.1 MAG: hypothetical protein UX26_C0011G0025 [Parcubacteria group bacterium GW2011_GWC1_45_9]
MGGGTGTYTVLSSLKQYSNFDLKAIVAMTDDGGSTGVLRDELGVLPPGDIRQCLVALSESPRLIRELMNYRFENGVLKGHSFGNLFLSALEKVSGSFDRALEQVSEIIKIKGEVVPVTLHDVTLEMVLNNGSVLKGEKTITPSEVIKAIGIKKYTVRPEARINFKAQKAIIEADYVVIGPGNLYTSIIPLFLIKGVKEALAYSKARKILIVNLVTRFGQNDSSSIFDFVDEVEKYLGKNVINSVVFNREDPPRYLKHRYWFYQKARPIIYKQKEKFVFDGKKFFGGNFIDLKISKQSKNDSLIKRNLIRHHPEKLAKFLIKLMR